MYGRFVSSAGIASAITALLGIHVGLDGLSLILNLLQGGAPIGGGQGAGLIIGIALLDVVLGLVYLGTLIVFCFWLHRAYSNLPALGSDSMRYTPGWAVGWLFIPFANLVTPYLVMGELWRASRTRVSEGGFPVTESAPLIGLWWGTYLAAGLFGTVQAFAASPHQPITLWALPTHAFRVVAGVMLILAVRGIVRRQDEQLSVAAPSAPAAQAPMVFPA